MIPEPKKSYELNCAIAEARRKFREWNDVAGVFGRGTGSMSEILGVIDDAVEIGWKAATEETVIGYTGLSPCDPANVGGPIAAVS